MLQNFDEILKKRSEFRAVQKCENLVELEKRCKMSIWSQKSALIQLRTDPLKWPSRLSCAIPLRRCPRRRSSHDSLLLVHAARRADDPAAIPIGANEDELELLFSQQLMMCCDVSD